MINLANRIRGLFVSARSSDDQPGPDPAWDELLSWTVGQPGDQSAANGNALAPAAPATTWAEGLAKARERRLTEDAVWSACLASAKAGRQREAAAQRRGQLSDPSEQETPVSRPDDDDEWSACLARAKAGRDPRAQADDDDEWLACLARAKAGAEQRAR